MVTDRPGERRSKAPPRTTPSRQVSQAERQAAFSRNKAEYRRRMLRDGPAAANRWLDEQAGAAPADARPRATTRTGKTSRSEEHTSELQSLMRISYAVFCLKQNNKIYNTSHRTPTKQNKQLHHHTHIYTHITST